MLSGRKRAEQRVLTEISGKSLAALITFSVLLTCGCRQESTDAHQTTQSFFNLGIELPLPKADQQNAVKTGEFKVRHHIQKSFLPARAKQNVRAGEERLEKIAAMLNERITLPQDLYISLKDCGRPDSYYDDETQEITVCTELAEDFDYFFTRETGNRARLNRKILGAMMFLFLHEVGHALIHILDLPVTGREEDAADQFSTVMLSRQVEGGELAAFDAANLFRLYAQWARRYKEPALYWDEHSQDEQRYYDTICLLYGENPSRFGFLVEHGKLPAFRAEICQDEFKRASKAWDTLLAPYFKKTARVPETQSRKDEIVQKDFGALSLLRGEGWGISLSPVRQLPGTVIRFP